MLRTSRETVALAEKHIFEPNVCAGEHISFLGNVDHSALSAFDQVLGVSSFIFVWVAWAKFCGRQQVKDRLYVFQIEDSED